MSEYKEPGSDRYGWLRLKAASVFQIAAFVLVIAAIASCKSNTPAKQLPSPGDSLAAVNDTIQSQYNATTVQLDALSTKNSMLDTQITEKDAAISKLKGQVGHLRRRNRYLAAQFRKDKKIISSIKDELADKIESFAQKIGVLQSDRDNLAHQRDSLRAKYNSLVGLASVLHASNIRLMALHLKHNGRKEKKTARARRTDELRILFDIDENRIAEDGMKNLYLAIKGPDGHLLKGASGSGAINTSDGTSLNYTLLKQIALKQDEPVRNVKIDWQQSGDYRKGVYSIAIYNGGYRIGGGDVTLN